MLLYFELKYWNRPTNQFLVSFLLFIGQLFPLHLSVSWELLKPFGGRWNCHTFLQSLWSISAWGGSPNPVRKNSNIMISTLSHRYIHTPDYSKLHLDKPSRCQRKHRRNWGCYGVEERGIEHKNPSEALFCYLEDNFHFNWQFKPM